MKNLAKYTLTQIRDWLPFSSMKPWELKTLSGGYTETYFRVCINMKEIFPTDSSRRDNTGHEWWHSDDITDDDKRINKILQKSLPSPT